MMSVERVSVACVVTTHSLSDCYIEFLPRFAFTARTAYELKKKEQAVLRTA